MRISDWSSDVCSSDLIVEVAVVPLAEEVAGHAPAGLLVSLDTDEAAEARAGGYRLLCEEAADRVRRNAVMLVPDPLPRSEEHTSELQSLMRISYAVFCLKKKKERKIKQENERMR